MARKLEKPITTREEYEKRLRKVKIQTVLIITIPSLIVISLLAILFTGGEVLTIFGVKNYRAVINVFYGAFYAITAIIIVAVLVFASVALIKALIAFIRDLKNKNGR